MRSKTHKSKLKKGQFILVKKLIEVLQELPQDMEVWKYRGEELGYAPCRDVPVRLVNVAEDSIANGWSWFEDGDKRENHNKQVCVLNLP